MDAGERTTGTRDEHYDLISVLYHALHGAENCEIYATDAAATGDADLAAFFRNAQATQRQLAEQAKERLGIGRVATLGTAEVGTRVPPEGVVGPEAPPRDVQRGTVNEPPPPGTVTGDVPPRTEETAPLGRGGASSQPEREREEDKGFLDRARDAILGEEEEPRRREETDRPEERR